MADPRFEVAVVGAGIVGASIAWHLARRGCPSVAVVEREIAPGMGSTAKAAGGIRAQFSSEINIRLSQLSLPRFENFPREMGVEVVFNQAGYLWMATTGEEMKRFEANVALQRRCGLDVELLDRAGVSRKAPYVRPDDLLGGAFHQRDGYAPPADYVMAYHKKAKELGVTFFFGEELVGREGRFLETQSRRLEADRVVIAAGAWSGRVGSLLGVDLPVEPVRRQCFVTEPIPELPHPIPMTVDYTSGVYMHTESGGLLIGKADKKELPGFRENADWSFLEEVAAQAMDRVPLLERATIRTGWGGLYEVTPDHHPILGEVGPGIYAACGFSGHGVMHAPATGQLMAELLVDGRTSSLDISSLRLERFKEGHPIVETNVI
jgi:sarcosine oxidase subunit beta